MDLLDLSHLQRRVEYQYDVFISYSSAQEAEARATYATLSPHMSVFFAPETLDTLDYEPDQYVEVLSDSLAQSCQTLVLLSERFLASSWCQLELYGALNLCTEEERRRLWIAPLEASAERELSGQFVPLLRSPDDAVAAVRRRFEEGDLKLGDRFADRTVPKMFVDLPLYELYEPPSAGKRPPWGKDSRSPHGIPGAPPFYIYEKMVREYMVQMERRRADADADGILLAAQDETLELSIPMSGIGEQYAYMPRAAREDASYLLSMGFLGHSGSTGGRLDGRWLFARAMLSFTQGQDHPELRLHEAFGRICMGQLEEIDRFEAAVAENADSSVVGYFRVQLAKAKYLARDYEGALGTFASSQVGAAGEDRLVRDACLARLNRLSAEVREENARSEVSVDRERMRSSLESREHLDFWAEGLALAGYRP
ncbi:MAG: toll/interleukin-1 receptor domain-containing protein [Pseudomonadota bacterium]